MLQIYQPQNCITLAIVHIKFDNLDIFRSEIMNMIQLWKYVIDDVYKTAEFPQDTVNKPFRRYISELTCRVSLSRSRGRHSWITAVLPLAFLSSSMRQFHQLEFALELIGLCNLETRSLRACSRHAVLRPDEER